MPPRKVYTPGSQPQPSSSKVRGRAKIVPVGVSPGRGRPKGSKRRLKGTSRVGNYRHKYKKEDILKALRAVSDKTMTLNQASKHFGVPKTTIHDRLHKASERVGRPTELSPLEEDIIVERLLLMGDWGFPMDNNDLKYLIKAYLDQGGRTTRFVNNVPGPDFVRGFLRRHKELSRRTANLIKRSRAAVSHEVVNSFFDQYEQSAAGIDPDNIYNYDETNLTDNPGAKKVIFRQQQIGHQHHVLWICDR
jgi:hypothetical protein